MGAVVNWACAVLVCVHLATKPTLSGSWLSKAGLRQAGWEIPAGFGYTAAVLAVRPARRPLAAHFALLSAAVTLSHALDAELETLLDAASALCCRALATSEPLVAAADACTNGEARKQG